MFHPTLWQQTPCYGNGRAQFQITNHEGDAAATGPRRSVFYQNIRILLHRQPNHANALTFRPEGLAPHHPSGSTQIELTLHIDFRVQICPMETQLRQHIIHPGPSCLNSSICFGITSDPDISTRQLMRYPLDVQVRSSIHMIKLRKPALARHFPDLILKIQLSNMGVWGFFRCQLSGQFRLKLRISLS